MPTAQRTMAVAATLLTLVALPAVASAQRRLEPVQVTAEATVRADEFHAKATALDGSTKRMRKVARLHEHSASLRQADDPQAYACLRTAAILRYWGGDKRGGAERMTEAATQAAERGDVYRAADAYIDAAIISAELRQAERTIELAAKARLLASSPLLSDQQRATLASRLGNPKDVATIALR
jgi:hypothetical protein